MEPRRFLPLLTALALLIVVQQALDLAMLLPSGDLATPAGRVRQVLALSGRSPVLLIADFLLVWAVVASHVGRRLRVLAGLHLGLGAALLLLLPVFLLDAGRVAGRFSGAESVAFRVAAARTLIVLGLLGAVFLLAGRALQGLGRAPDPAPQPAP